MLFYPNYFTDTITSKGILQIASFKIRVDTSMFCIGDIIRDTGGQMWHVMENIENNGLLARNLQEGKDEIMELIDDKYNMNKIVHKVYSVYTEPI